MTPVPCAASIALAKVSERIRQGGAGPCSAVVMPPQPALRDAGIQTLATWVSGGAK